MNKKIDLKSLVFYSFLIVYSILLIYLAVKLNIWEDEAYSLQTTSNPLRKVITQSYNFEGQPPFYFIALAIWRHLNSGFFFARLFSLMFIGLSAWIFYKLVHLISGTEFSRWMLVIFLLNPFIIWAGLEIRLYALAIFLSVISVYYFLRYSIENKNKYLYLFLLFCLIGLYTQYFFVFEIAALGISILLFKGWNKFFSFCLYFIPVILLFLPNLFFLSAQVKMGQTHAFATNDFSTVLHSPQALVLGLELAPPLNVWVNRIPRIILAIAMVIAYYKLYKKTDTPSRNYLKNINLIGLLTIIVFLFYVVTVSTIHLGFEPRYMILALPMFIFLFTIFKVYKSLLRNLLFYSISIFYLVIFLLIYKTLIKSYDYKQAAQFISKIKSPNEPVLVYSKILLPAFSFYYKAGRAISLPDYKYDEKYYNENISDTNQLNQAIRKIYSATNSYILLSGPIKGFKDSILMNGEVFDQYLNSNFNITVDTSIVGQSKENVLRIRRLEIKK